MASVTYEEIFSNFLGNITDYNLQENLSISDSEELMTEYLHKAASHTYTAHIFSSHKLHDEVHLFEYEMEISTDDDADKEFVITALAKWMVYEWLHKQVRAVTLTAQVFGGKELSAFSQANHLAQLRGLQDDVYAEARRYICDRGTFVNSYLGGA